MELFFHISGMVHGVRARASLRHTRAVWEMRRWLFSIWKENICLCTQLTADRLTVREIRTPLSISDWLYIRRSGRRGWEASGYTSDKWWIGNKWGILTGNIRDIKKEPRTPRRISHIERLKSDTPVLSESNKGHVRRDMEYSRDTFAHPRLNPFWKKKRTTEYMSGIYPENLIKDPDRIRQKKGLI